MKQETNTLWGVNIAKSWLHEKTNKIDKSLVRLTKQTRTHKQPINGCKGNININLRQFKR